MTKQAKILLGVSLAAFAVSATGILWGLFLPVGAVFLGLFLISNLLGRELAQFDEEQRLRLERAERSGLPACCAGKTGREEALGASRSS
jgi:hypothetical protein